MHGCARVATVESTTHIVGECECVQGGTGVLRDEENGRM